MNGGRLGLGRWQRVFFRGVRRGQDRELTITMMGGSGGHAANPR